MFDPTDGDLFAAQRQQFDWCLLQNAFVRRYDTPFQLGSACTRLKNLGYLVHRLDADGWGSIADMHAALADAMSFPSYYGANSDAFKDVLRDVAQFDYGSDPDSTGTVVAIGGFDTVVELDPHTAHTMLDAFAKQARLAALYTHPMLCLVHAATPNLPAVGGMPVYRGPVWDVEPFPPWPFDRGDILELEYQVYADGRGIEDYVQTLREVLGGTLDAVERCQISDPVLASERAAALNAAHRPVPPPENTQLWVVAVGVRGQALNNDRTGVGNWWH
ncbi:barstar family protein [Rhodococcus kroppenstedtii]|uniref:Barstar family protein n=1 Tax=Rhodococcoides kroppenstedtii TaxID=293050 RepID=A0ABS7NYT8_9NOCA|nr:barstar family protein [Rhodococcus kroppenstedtii]MBY6322555.1 barstar family protein [Rhodococcus kroppenstedtii]MBY6401359.1 barstar family protein [Rhodococcus kroppenstedtii]